MVGPPSSDAYLNDLLQLSSSLGADRIQFAGPAYGEKRSMEYEQAGIFVLPTRNENFGVAVAEALAHGVPAIVTKGAPWSAIERHRCGWWIDHGVDPLTSALREAMSQNPDQLAAMGERGRAWMASEFSWRNVAENMVAAYETALSDTGRP